MNQLAPTRLNLFPNGIQPLRDEVHAILSLMDNDEDVQQRDGRQTAFRGPSEPYARAETQFEWAEKRTRMADERTDWALERTVLAS